MKRQTLWIEGMSCAHCVRALREALSRIPGLEVLTVEIGRAEVQYDPHQVSGEHIHQAVQEAGYRLQTPITLGG
jgi:copper chaperone